jgi:anaerobic selenocysteine-containing dehydrogenase
MLSTICIALSDSGWLAGVGVKYGTDSREIAESDLIVVWGGNPVSTQVNVMTHISRARKSRGTPLVVVDPYRTGTAEVADIHLMPRPGTDGALACAVMHVLFKEGFADRDYLARYTDVPGELEAHLQSRTPEWAEKISGVPAASIVDFARLYGRTKKSFIRVGYGFSRSRNGAAQLHAVTCLPAVTGAWRERGGGALYSNGGLYRIDKTLIEGLDACLDRSRMGRLQLRTGLRKLPRSLDQSRMGPVLTGDKRDLGDGPPVTALLIQNTNPAVVCPKSNKVRQGLAREDLFTCVHEQFMTDTAKMADIVLPATTFLEHDDLCVAGGHTYLQIARKVVEPYAEARPNHFVICELARRLGARHRGFAMSEMEMIEETLRLSGKPSTAAFEQGRWLDCAPSFEDAHFLSGFGHADGKFRFKPDWKAVGVNHAKMPVLPDHATLIEEADAEHPFRMVAAPARSFLNTTFTETPGLPSPGEPAERDDPPAGCEPALHRRRRAASYRQQARLHSHPCPPLRRAPARRGGGGEHLAQ